MLRAQSLTRLNAPFGARCFMTDFRSRMIWKSQSSLNAPFGARCFMTLPSCSLSGTPLSSLNAPFGARCFMTVRRVIPCVTRQNRQLDRRQLKKHPSNLQARDQIIRVFVAVPRIATNASMWRPRPGNEGIDRRVAMRTPGLVVR